MLLRRAIRKRLISSLQVRNENVVSHTNGSITIAMRGITPEEVRERCVAVFVDWGWDDMVQLRSGVRNLVAYVTFSSEALVTEAERRYGYSVRQHLEAAQNMLNGSSMVSSVVASGPQVDIPEEDIDFAAITAAVAGLELEASER